METHLAFSDVLILPQFSVIKSRSEVDPTVMFLDEKIIPIMSANMDAVTGSEMSNAMHNYGALGALHRFQSIEENVSMFKAAPNSLVSIGLGNSELERAAALSYAGANKFIIDVAHAASMEVVKQTKALRHIIGKTGKIVVGNFATGTSVMDYLFHLGRPTVQAIKLGIGSGSACTTRVVTGCGAPTLSSILSCKNIHLPIIADGGFREPGDLTKALAAGADVVMLGKVLAGSDEAPSDRVGDEKKYRGSASMEAYKQQGKVASHRTAEGESFLIPCTGPVNNTLEHFEAGLRSAMSYVGASTISEFKEFAELVQVTNAGIAENGAHGKRT